MAPILLILVSLFKTLLWFFIIDKKNLEGYVHELFTVIKIENVELFGESSKKFSWFPGYAWTSIVCGRVECNVHLGWKFSASKLLPKTFYGISRRSFKLIAEN